MSASVLSLPSEFVGRKVDESAEELCQARLTKKERQLLDVLLDNPGRSISREHLLETVWGYRSDAKTRTVDVHVQRLRRKLGPSADRLKTIVRGGYCWFPDSV